MGLSELNQLLVRCEIPGVSELSPEQSAGEQLLRSKYGLSIGEVGKIEGAIMNLSRAQWDNFEGHTGLWKISRAAYAHEILFVILIPVGASEEKPHDSFPFHPQNAVTLTRFCDINGNNTQRTSQFDDIACFKSIPR